jgi:hypothetical protein
MMKLAKSAPRILLNPKIWGVFYALMRRPFCAAPGRLTKGRISVEKETLND